MYIFIFFLLNVSTFFLMTTVLKGLKTFIIDFEITKLLIITFSHLKALQSPLITYGTLAFYY